MLHEREPLLDEMAARIVAGEQLTAAEYTLFDRLGECRAKVLCTAVCGKCRARRARKRKFHLAITDEEWEAAKAELWHRRREPFSTERVNRYVHETLRRRNAPYRAVDLRVCARVSEDEQDEVRAKAQAAGLSVNAYVRAMLGLERWG